MNEHGEILHQTPLKEVFNLRWYIQHLMDESEHENENPLNHENWVKQTNWKFIKYVIHHKHSMTPEQLKQKPVKEIFKIQHENLDTEEGESNEEKEESTTSSESQSKILSLACLLKEPTQTFQTHNIVNETTHDEENPSEIEDNTSEENSVYEIKSHIVNGEQNEQETKLLITNFEVKVEN